MEKRPDSTDADVVGKKNVAGDESRLQLAFMPFGQCGGIAWRAEVPIKRTDVRQWRL
ncbi:hypothetical protein D3C84_1060550 [compost metagenome]